MVLSGRVKLLIQKFTGSSFLSTPGRGQMLIFTTEMNGNFTPSSGKGRKTKDINMIIPPPFFWKWLHTLRLARALGTLMGLISPTWGLSPPCPGPYFSPDWGYQSVLWWSCNGAGLQLPCSPAWSWANLWADVLAQPWAVPVPWGLGAAPGSPCPVQLLAGGGGMSHGWWVLPASGTPPNSQH